MVGSKSDIAIEVVIMRKLDLMHDTLYGVDANIAVLRSRISAVELGQIELAQAIHEAVKNATSKL